MNEGDAVTQLLLSVDEEQANNPGLLFERCIERHD